MVQPRKMLILTSKTGGGHVSLAEALRDRLQSDYTICREDLLPGFIPRSYEIMARRASWLWSFAFHLTDTPSMALLGHLTMIPLIAPRLTALLRQFQPDLVLSVHPLLTYAAKRVLDQHAPGVPFAMLFSDPIHVHCACFTELQAEAVFAPTQEIYAQALARGFDPARLLYVGWPVRRQFTSILALPREQVIIAAGTNRALYRRCQGVKHLYAFPFTSEIAPFMAAAHVTMGRCSPNILFESLALGKPLIVTSYLPGQEENNMRFIERHGLGWSAIEECQLRKLVATLVTEFPTDRSMLNVMSTKVQRYQRMNAAANESIVPLIRALIDA